MHALQETYPIVFLLTPSRLIDGFSRLVGKLAIWLIFAAARISAGNATMRKAFNVGPNAFLEIQWYLAAPSRSDSFGMARPPCIRDPLAI